VETAHPGEPAIQGLVRSDPDAFARHDAARRTEAGFPPGYPVFRIIGTAEIPDRLAAMGPVNLLVSGDGDERVCLVTVSPEALDELVTAVRLWARAGEVRRVEAEPHL
jgi:primosomal protein N'